jgi:hypothetical protein
MSSIKMPKKRDPFIDKIIENNKQKKFFDSADYEIKKHFENDPQKKEELKNEALKLKKNI